MKHLKSKSRRGLVTRRIVYRTRAHPHNRPQEIKVDVRRGEVIDAGYAAAMVAVRTSIPLRHVTIIAVTEVE